MLTDLGGVTRTLKRLIDAGLRLQNVSTTNDVEISAAPPDEAFNPTPPATVVVSTYLYHVIESPETKNLPPTTPGASPVPISLSPLGLILQYIVTVVITGAADDLLDSRTLLTQKYIGFIARVVHDTPSITKKTQITVPDSTAPGGVVTIDIMDTDLAATNTEIEIVMRPAPKEETVAFWSSEEKHVPRLSLFLEARVAILEAAPPPIAPGIVLRIGQFVFPNSSPQLITTQSDVWFQPPPGFGDPRKIATSPARVALFDSPGSTDVNDFISLVPPDPPGTSGPRAGFTNNNRITVNAVGLAPGHRLLLLRRGDASITIDLDQPEDQRPAFNQNWQLQSTPDLVTFLVFRDIFDSATKANATIVPGSWAVRVVLVDTRVLDTPQPRASNELPFTITPQIISAQPATPAAAAVYAVRIVGAYLDSTLDIFLGVGGVTLKRVDTPTLNPGEFFVPVAPAAPVNTITLRIATTAPAPSPSNPVPVQLVINGATATPAWITTEATGI